MIFRPWPQKLRKKKIYIYIYVFYVDFEGIVIFIDFLSVLGEGSYAIRTRLCSPNTLFSFRIFSQKQFLWPPILKHFGGLGRTFGSKGVPRGGFGGV